MIWLWYAVFLTCFNPESCKRFQRIWSWFVCNCLLAGMLVYHLVWSAGCRRRTWHDWHICVIMALLKYAWSNFLSWSLCIGSTKLFLATGQVFPLRYAEVVCWSKGIYDVLSVSYPLCRMGNWENFQTRPIPRVKYLSSLFSVERCGTWCVSIRIRPVRNNDTGIAVALTEIVGRVSVRLHVLQQFELGICYSRRSNESWYH